ncbi:MAG: DUF433 domain-containing protein [Candidatus Woesebacteria bacterium]|jgi:uncharacterized protein (DUF433 family)
MSKAGKSVNIPIKYPVVTDPKILGGTPIIKGTRIPASLVFELFRRGYSTQILREEYPSLTKRKLAAFLTLMSNSFNDHSSKTV